MVLEPPSNGQTHESNANLSLSLTAPWSLFDPFLIPIPERLSGIGRLKLKVVEPLVACWKPVTIMDSLPSLSSGILKRECAVRPFGKIDAATPEVAVASAILLADLMVASKARYKKVLPVPPGPSMKKEVPAFFPTAYVTWVKLSARTMHHVSQHGCIEMWIFIFIRYFSRYKLVKMLRICKFVTSLQYQQQVHMR
ncbi:uncharacterized protein LOC131304326 isoform X6 [Rhododendron vialii]|uniref:uncharacterized protein LOC131304326 isoform X6 n=1 Tax=Rhododendron vialii TaxID=182163 RepID=UPI00265F57D4|nr:uncharacterized protein LOC131304326 isoform X6 [Rhododendron vialii]